MFSFVRKRLPGISNKASFLARTVALRWAVLPFTLTGPLEAQAESIPGCVCEGVLGVWIGRLRKADCPPQCGGSVQLAEGPSGTKRWGEVEFALSASLRWDAGLALRHWLSWVTDSNCGVPSFHNGVGSCYNTSCLSFTHTHPAGCVSLESQTTTDPLFSGFLISPSSQWRAHETYRKQTDWKSGFGDQPDLASKPNYPLLTGSPSMST